MGTIHLAIFYTYGPYYDSKTAKECIIVKLFFTYQK